MEQGVAGQDVGVGLDTPLGIDNAGDIVELAKEVEAVEHPCEAAFEHGVRQAGIPILLSYSEVFILLSF